MTEIVEALAGSRSTRDLYTRTRRAATMSVPDRSQIEIFSKGPPSKDFPRETYVQQVIDVASWSEQAGCTASLMCTDNSIVDPWLLSQLLLSSPAPVTFEDKCYKVDNLKMSPPLAPELFPGILMSGSSDAGMAAAWAAGATAVQYPKPAKDVQTNPVPDGEKSGIRVGIIARPKGGDAWSVANERFPGDRRGQLAHQLAMRVSDSVWHQQLSQIIKEVGEVQGVYWMWPFQNYQTFCPYLVGSYEEVSEEVSRYMRGGFESFILDIPPSREELGHIQT